MRIFIFTYDRYDSLTTPLFFEKHGIEHTVLCHSPEAKRKYIEAGKVNPRKLVATLRPKGLARNRNFALSLMREGEWALFFVDDLKNIYEFDGYDTEGTEKLHIDIKETTKWQKRFRKKINAVEFLKRCEEIIKKAEQEGVELVGFAGFSNALFLTEKWKRDVFADGRCWLVKKGALRFDENVNSIDDYAWTVANIKHKGVLVNQWIIPDCRRYTKGGLGSKVQRIRQKMKECEYLVNKHPDMLYFAKKPGWPDGSHIRFYHKRPKIGQERRKDAE